MDNPEKLATLGTQDTRLRQTKQKTQHYMCWTILSTTKIYDFSLSFALITLAEA